MWPLTVIFSWTTKWSPLSSKRSCFWLSQFFTLGCTSRSYSWKKKRNSLKSAGYFWICFELHARFERIWFLPKMWIFFIIFCFLAYLAFSASVNEHLLVLFLVETTEQPALQFRNGNWGRDLTQVHLPIKSNQTFQKLGSKISYAKILLRTFSIIVSI